jgi:hypothetical protein
MQIKQSVQWPVSSFTDSTVCAMACVLWTSPCRVDPFCEEFHILLKSNLKFKSLNYEKTFESVAW